MRRDVLGCTSANPARAFEMPWADGYMLLTIEEAAVFDTF